MNKYASHIVNSTFEKIAEETKKEKNLSSKKKFLEDRLGPAAASLVAGAVGQGLGNAAGLKLKVPALGVAGGLAGTYGVTKAFQKNNENKGYAKATAGDTAKAMLVSPFTAGLGWTPNTIAKDKERKRLIKKKED